MTDKPKRRWYQFSLRTLLVALTLLCIGPGGWVAYRQHRERRQQAAVEAIERVRGEIRYVARIPPRSTAMQFFLGDEKYENVDSLDFTLNKELADSDLVHFQQFPRLRELSLFATEISDDGLVHLASLTSLERLDLHHTRITDKGLVHLKRLTALKSLCLMDTEVNDSGLIHLTPLTKLEWLLLDGAKVSQAGIGRLGKSLPNLKIVCSSPLPSPPTVYDPFADFPGVEILPTSSVPAPNPPKP